MRPPTSGASRVTSPSWASATAATIERPRPAPSEPVRTAARVNGSSRVAATSGGRRSPALDTAKCDRPPSHPVSTVTGGQPWREALSKRLRTRRSSSAGSPSTGAGARSAFAPGTSPIPALARSARSTRRCSGATDWLRARARRLSMSTSLRSVASLTTPAMRRYSSTPASGSLSVTSVSAPMIASGVRSSCDALATKRRCASKAACRRSRRASNVAASSRSSSSGPSREMRSSRFRSDIRRAVSVMSCRGRSTRPATVQPRATATTATTPSATRDWRVAAAIVRLRNSLATPTKTRCTRSSWGGGSGIASGGTSRRRMNSARWRSGSRVRVARRRKKFAAIRIAPMSRNNPPYRRVSRSRTVGPRRRPPPFTGDTRRPQPSLSTAAPPACAAGSSPSPARCW